MPILNTKILHTIDQISKARMACISAKSDKQLLARQIDLNGLFTRLEAQLYEAAQEEAQSLFRIMQRKKQE
jgi:hypothetical protein